MDDTMILNLLKNNDYITFLNYIKDYNSKEYYLYLLLISKITTLPQEYNHKFTLQSISNDDDDLTNNIYNLVYLNNVNKLKEYLNNNKVSTVLKELISKYINIKENDLDSLIINKNFAKAYEYLTSKNNLNDYEELILRLINTYFNIEINNNIPKSNHIKCYTLEDAIKNNEFEQALNMINGIKSRKNICINILLQRIIKLVNNNVKERDLNNILVINNDIKSITSILNNILNDHKLSKNEKEKEINNILDLINADKIQEYINNYITLNTSGKNEKLNEFQMFFKTLISAIKSKVNYQSNDKQYINNNIKIKIHNSIKELKENGFVLLENLSTDEIITAYNILRNINNIITIVRNNNIILINKTKEIDNDTLLTNKELAKEELNSANYDTALSYALDCLNHPSQRPSTFVYIGIIYERLNNIKTAIQAYKIANMLCNKYDYSYRISKLNKNLINEDNSLLFLEYYFMIKDNIKDIDGFKIINNISYKDIDVINEVLNYIPEVMAFTIGTCDISLVLVNNQKLNNLEISRLNNQYLELLDSDMDNNQKQNNIIKVQKQLLSHYIIDPEIFKNLGHAYVNLNELDKALDCFLIVQDFFEKYGFRKYNYQGVIDYLNIKVNDKSNKER